MGGTDNYQVERGKMKVEYMSVPRNIVMDMINAMALLIVLR